MADADRASTLVEDTALGHEGDATSATQEKQERQQQREPKELEGIAAGDICLIVIVVSLLLFFDGFVAYQLDAPLPWHLVGLGPPEHELTKLTWDKRTEAEDVFVKFYAPWCGHCKAMKADWEQLRQDYSNLSFVKVAEVNCIGQGRSLCQQVGIKSFPTLEYGDASDMEGLRDYKGARTYQALSEFAASQFGPRCGPNYMDLCSTEEKQKVKELLAMDVSKLKELTDEKMSEVKKVEGRFDKVKEDFAADYNRASKEKDAKKAKIKESLDFLRAIIKMEAVEERNPFENVPPNSEL
uniref:Thioredoxin n=1 Tax=Pfiesteria piscicida TaxID=71001 RepID=A3E3K1_PFIPI|nr:thioredoxin [Pfiesteria piscicida]